jgi:fructose-bisphosphate aldolase class II
MESLLKTIKKAEKAKVTIGHFNVSTLEQVKAIANVSLKLHCPMIIGVSESERDFIGINQIVALVRSYRADGAELFLNADHTRSIEGVALASKTGFDSIIFDGANLSFSENIRMTKEAVRVAKKYAPFGKKPILEAELGYIGTSSKMLDKIPEGVAVDESHFTTPEEAREFVKKTGIDMLAPAVGNLHGMLKNSPNPKLDIERISKIRASAGVPLVLHGGSGISDEDFKNAISAGISVIHISTELRVLWRKSVEKSFVDFNDEIAPYKLLSPVVAEMEKFVERRANLFRNSCL